MLFQNLFITFSAAGAYLDVFQSMQWALTHQITSEVKAFNLYPENRLLFSPEDTAIMIHKKHFRFEFIWPLDSCWLYLSPFKVSFNPEKISGYLCANDFSLHDRALKYIYECQNEMCTESCHFGPCPACAQKCLQIVESFDRIITCRGWDRGSKSS